MIGVECFQAIKKENNFEQGFYIETHGKTYKLDLGIPQNDLSISLLATEVEEVELFLLEEQGFQIVPLRYFVFREFVLTYYRNILGDSLFELKDSAFFEVLQKVL